MSKVKYTIDGRDPKAKGYVKDDALAKSRERVEGEKVWVLTIYKDEQFFPCVHKSLEGAIDTAIADMKEGMEDEGDYNFPFISKVLYKQMYWKDELSGAVYDIAECKVFA